MEQTNTRKCEHAQDYGGDLADEKLYTCGLNGLCDMQRPFGDGKPFCRIPLNRETWYDEAGKPRFQIWHIQGETGELLKMCCIPECKRIQIEETWLAREQGESLYDRITAEYNKDMKISHTYCPQCYEKTMAEIQREQK